MSEYNMNRRKKAFLTLIAVGFFLAGFEVVFWATLIAMWVLRVAHTPLSFGGDDE